MLSEAVNIIKKINFSLNPLPQCPIFSIVALFEIGLVSLRGSTHIKLLYERR